MPRVWRERFALFLDHQVFPLIWSGFQAERPTVLRQLPHQLQERSGARRRRIWYDHLVKWGGQLAQDVGLDVLGRALLHLVLLSSALTSTNFQSHIRRPRVVGMLATPLSTDAQGSGCQYFLGHRRFCHGDPTDASNPTNNLVIASYGAYQLLRRCCSWSSIALNAGSPACLLLER